MHLTQLQLTEFRSIRQLDAEFPPDGFGLVGANAAGKSSLLEAVSMLATTRSSRSSADRDVIHWASGQELGVAPYARLSGLIEAADSRSQVEIGLELAPNGDGRLKKSIQVDGKRMGAAKAIGTLTCSLFEPTDIDLISGSPTVRRRYLDVMLSQIESGYISSLSRYQRIVEQRNRLLKSLIRDGHSATSELAAAQLDYWDNELVAHGATIREARMRAVGFLQDLASRHISAFMQSAEFNVEYRLAEEREGWFDQGPSSSNLAAGEIGQLMAQTMASVRDHEFRRGVTIVGPHRDDLVIVLNDVSLASFGSRGQQRLGAVALKLAEAELMNLRAGEQPVILLDDVLSELDDRHRTTLVSAISNIAAQIIVTSTEKEQLDLAGLSLPRTARLTAGRFEWID